VHAMTVEPNLQTINVGQSPRIRALHWVQASVQQDQSVAGFTLIESFVVVGMMFFLSAFAVPTWLQFVGRQGLDSSQNQAYEVVRIAQNTAIQQNDHWQASFRQMGDIAQWAVHPVDAIPTEANWGNFRSATHIDSKETTLRHKDGIYRVQFTHKGHVNGQLGRLTFSTPHGGQTKRCVFISTLLGAMRRGENQHKPDTSGRYCY